MGSDSDDPRSAGTARAAPPAMRPWQRQAMRAAAAACRVLLGVEPAQVQKPASRRASLRVVLADGRSVIATRRERRKYIEIEHIVLRALAAAGVPAPAVLGFDGTWLIQEFIEGPRLSQALAVVDAVNGEALLGRAAEALLDARHAVEAAGLAERLPVVGSSGEHLAPAIEAPVRVGQRLGIPAPPLPAPQLVRALRVETPCFARRDTRGVNAIVRTDGTLVWIDWEFCVRGHPLEDLVPLLADEYTPDWPAAEQSLLARFGDAFAPGLGPAARADYLAQMGSLRCAARIGQILDSKREGPWWPADKCLERDLIGVAPEYACRICARGARWAGATDLTRHLAPWFRGLAEGMEFEIVGSAVGEGGVARLQLLPPGVIVFFLIRGEGFPLVVVGAFAVEVDGGALFVV